MTSISIEVCVHETPADVWDALDRVFTPQTRGTSRWITLSKDGVNVNFFGPQITPVTDPQDEVPL